MNHCPPPSWLMKAEPRMDVNILQLSDISLVHADSLHAIALPVFVAAWKHCARELASGDAEDEQWRSCRMPLLAYPGGDPCQLPAFYSLEILCRIFGETGRWSLAEDPDFFVRNSAAVHADAEGSAVLTAYAIAAWDHLAIDNQHQMSERVDARIFPVIFAYHCMQTHTDAAA